MNLDPQTIFNFVAGGLMAVGGWFARELWGAVKELRTDLSKLREELAREYISKNDFREAVRDLRELLERIDNKLDRKQDKA